MNWNRWGMNIWPHRFETNIWYPFRCPWLFNSYKEAPIFEPTCAYYTVGSYASLSVCLSVRPSVTLLKIHSSESIIGKSLKLYPMLLLYIWHWANWDWLHSQKILSANGYIWLIANVKLHFFQLFLFLFWAWLILSPYRYPPKFTIFLAV